MRVKGQRKILLNRTLISGKELSSFFKRINYFLQEKYHLKISDTIYLSGDLASYIQQAPDRIWVCKAIYVPDKYHVKSALKKSLGLVTTDAEINNRNYQKDIINALNQLDDVDSKKIRNLMKRKPSSFSSYLKPSYEGCSQEGMNSHYYCSRFDKVPNVFRFKTIEKLSQLIEANQNHNEVKIGFKSQYYDEPSMRLGEKKMERYRPDINTEEMSYGMRQLFSELENGYKPW